MDVFERNRHGHAVLTITGMNINGAKEVTRLKGAGYRVTTDATLCFTSLRGNMMSIRTPGYDEKHRLITGKTYKIPLVPGREIMEESERTTKNLRALGKKYGYGIPLAGILPRVCELVSDEQMRKMKIEYIAGLHDPIYAGYESALKVLLVASCSYTHIERPTIDAHFAFDDDEWDSYGAYAFIDLAS